MDIIYSIARWLPIKDLLNYASALESGGTELDDQFWRLQLSYNCDELTLEHVHTVGIKTVELNNNKTAILDSSYKLLRLIATPSLISLSRFSNSDMSGAIYILNNNPHVDLVFMQSVLPSTDGARWLLSTVKTVASNLFFWNESTDHAYPQDIWKILSDRFRNHGVTMWARRSDKRCNHVPTKYQRLMDLLFTGSNNEIVNEYMNHIHDLKALSEWFPILKQAGPQISHLSNDQIDDWYEATNKYLATTLSPIDYIKELHEMEYTLRGATNIYVRKVIKYKIKIQLFKLKND